MLEDSQFNLKPAKVLGDHEEGYKPQYRDVGPRYVLWVRVILARIPVHPARSVFLDLRCTDPTC